MTAWKRFVVLFVFGLLLPGSVLAADGLLWRRRETTDYSCMHYWLPGYYRWRAYLRPVNVPFPVQQTSSPDESENVPAPAELRKDTPMPPAPAYNQPLPKP